MADPAVVGGYPPANGVESPVPNRRTVVDDSDQPQGGLLLWLDEDGSIACLEHWWIGDERPETLPAPDSLVAGLGMA